MTYRILADLILILHLFFIIFVLVGGFLSLKHPRWVWLHLPAVVWGVWIEWSGRICPLTPLENHFRRLASGQGYETGFIEHYLLPLIYPGKLTASIQTGLALAAIVINLAIYLFVCYRLRKSPGSVDE